MNPRLPQVETSGDHIGPNSGSRTFTGATLVPPDRFPLPLGPVHRPLAPKTPNTDPKRPKMRPKWALRKPQVDTTRAQRNARQRSQYEFKNIYICKYIYIYIYIYIFAGPLAHGMLDHTNHPLPTSQFSLPPPQFIPPSGWSWSQKWPKLRPRSARSMSVTAFWSHPNPSWKHSFFS